MKRPNDEHFHLLRILNRMPRNMLKLHGTDNVCEFVLHDLCCSSCFNLKKAAYFVDNPSFNCLKGVAGYEQKEAYSGDIWHDPSAFSEHMKSASFNQKVRNALQYSCKNCQEPDETVMKAIAQDLGMEDFAYCSWDLKHDNHGYLIYQVNKVDEIELEDLISGLCLLGFCPVF